MQEQELTQAQLDRQDEVDNACFNFILELSGERSADDGGKVEWDMETIQEIREAVQDVIVDKLHLMTEMEFYPYIELENTVPAEQLQTEIDLIQAWLKTTTESYADYTWDGSILILFNEEDEEIERYERAALVKLIPELGHTAAPSVKCSCGTVFKPELVGGQYQYSWSGSCPKCERLWLIEDVNAQSDEESQECK